MKTWGPTAVNRNPCLRYLRLHPGAGGVQRLAKLTLIKARAAAIFRPQFRVGSMPLKK